MFQTVNVFHLTLPIKRKGWQCVMLNLHYGLTLHDTFPVVLLSVLTENEGVVKNAALF